jgi:hypothetical protein
VFFTAVLEMTQWAVWSIFAPEGIKF